MSNRILLLVLILMVGWQVRLFVITNAKLLEAAKILRELEAEREARKPFNTKKPIPVKR